MEKILERIEGVIEKFIADLEQEPIKTSIKLLTGDLRGAKDEE